MTKEHLRHGQSLLEAKAEQSLGAIDETRRSIDTSGLVALNNQSLLVRLSSIITR